VVAAAAIYALTRPEPTPAERLSEAAQEAGGTLSDAVDDLTSAAGEAAEALRVESKAQMEELEASATILSDTISGQMNETSGEVRKEIESLIADWRETGIVTDNGIDFDAAISSVDTSEMPTETKTQVIAVMEFLRDTPGDAKVKLEELEKSLAR
ncbi:MAG: hypothetical protein AB8B71_07855, partial [Paracoccaceae bacterium]